jgi:hypothetical protein
MTMLALAPAMIAVAPAMIAVAPAMIAVAPAETLAAPAAETRAQAAAEPAVAVTRCTARETRTAVRRFVAEFNRGDLRALDRRFAPAERFEWYSTSAPGERFNDAAKDRATLIPYLKARHAKHERLTLRSLKYNGAGESKYGNFEFTLTRRADDLRAAPYSGKGAAWCHRRAADELFVWSMAPGQR